MTVIPGSTTLTALKQTERIVRQIGSVQWRSLEGVTYMMSQIIWMIILTVSVCAIILSAAIGDPQTLMAMTGIVSFALALIAIGEHRHLKAANATRGALSASIARHMGLIWAWGALGLLVSYGLILSETWPSWVIYFGFTGATASACLLFAATFDRDEKLGRKDDAMLKLGRYLMMTQMAGMLTTLIAIAIDPNKQLLTTTQPDWIANNIFVAGAIALTAICAYALMQDKTPDNAQLSAAA